MKFLKKTGIVLLVLVCLYLLTCIFLPSEIIISREKKIKADKELLFSFVNELKNWNSWNPWNKMDMAMKISYFGPAAGEGAGYEWKSNNSNLANGKLTITKVQGTDSIMVDVFMEGYGNSLSCFYFEQADSFAFVTWKTKAKVGFIGRVFPGLFMDGFMGKYLEQGLNDMDSMARLVKPAPKEGVEGIAAFSKKNVLCILDSCPEHDLAFKISQLYARIQSSFEAGTEVDGAPLLIYHSANANNVVFDAAISVKKLPAKIENEKIKVRTIDFKKALIYNYYGSYSDIKIAYGRIAVYLEQKNLKQNGDSVEEYMSDAESETDVKKWLTRIYVPLE